MSSEILASVRDELRGRGGGAAFSVLRVASGIRGPAVPAGWAAIGLVAVLALAVLGGRLDTGPTRPTAVGGASASPSATSGPTADGSPSPSPSSTAGPAGPLSAAELRAALDNGSLAGHLVLVAGALSSVPLPCSSPAKPDCFGIALQGLDGVAMTWDGPLSSGNVSAMSGTLAFVVRDQGLVFLGRVDGDIGAPRTVARLLAGPGGVGSPFSLAVVSGWLVVGGVHTSPLLPPGATPYAGPGPWLTDDKPFPEGMLAGSQGTNVLTLGLPVGRPPGQIVTPGPFLVRRTFVAQCADVVSGPRAEPCYGGVTLGWQVVAVLDPEIMVRAVVP